MTLAQAIDAWSRGDSSGLDAYEATHPGTDLGPDAHAYLWAASKVLAYFAYLRREERGGWPTELMLLAEQIQAGPAAQSHRWTPWDEKPNETEENL